MQINSLKQTNRVLLICAAACLVYYDIAGGLWLKGVTSCWFVLLGGVNLWAARKLQWTQLRFFILTEAGLVCGMCADVLLGIAFFAGVGTFALGHILYFIAFCTLEIFCLRDLKVIVPLAFVSVLLVTVTPLISVEDPLLQKLIPCYALIISMMMGKAITNLIRKPDFFPLAAGHGKFPVLVLRSGSGCGYVRPIQPSDLDPLLLHLLARPEYPCPRTLPCCLSFL